MKAPIPLPPLRAPLIQASCGFIASPSAYKGVVLSPEGLHRKALNPKNLCFRYYIHRVHLDLVCSVLGVAVWIAQSLL